MKEMENSGLKNTTKNIAHFLDLEDKNFEKSKETNSSPEKLILIIKNDSINHLPKIVNANNVIYLLLRLSIL